MRRKILCGAAEGVIMITYASIKNIYFKGPNSATAQVDDTNLLYIASLHVKQEKIIIHSNRYWEKLQTQFFPTYVCYIAKQNRLYISYHYHSFVWLLDKRAFSDQLNIWNGMPRLPPILNWSLARLPIVSSNVKICQIKAKLLAIWACFHWNTVSG